MPTFWDSLLDLIFPPRQECPFCRVPSDGAAVCVDCRVVLQEFQIEQRCRLCGRFMGDRLTVHSDEECLCADCQRSGRPFEFALAPGPYEGILKDTIHRLKYGGERHLAAPLAGLMSDQMKRAGILLQRYTVDLLIAPPLSRDKLIKRGFNQAGLLGVEISHLTGIPFNEQVIEKIAGTPSQTGLPRAVREVNLYGAFKVTDEQALAGKTVLLVDDVFTTGSTASAITEVVKAAGAMRVFVVTATTGRVYAKHKAQIKQ